MTGAAAGRDPGPLFLILARAGSVAFVLGAKAWLVPKPRYILALFAATMAHYALGLVYSRGAIAERLADPIARARLALWAPLCAFAAYAWWPAGRYAFGLHLAASETWLFERAEGRSSAPLAAARFGLAACLYFAVLLGPMDLTVPSGIESLGALRAAAVLKACAAACALLAGALLARSRAGAGEWARLAAFEAPWLLLLAVPDLRYRDLIFYHSVSWMLFPLSGLAAERGRTARFAAAAAAAAAAAGIVGRPMHQPEISRHLNAWGLLHIGLSVALSRHNPRAVADAFAPARARAS